MTTPLDKLLDLLDPEQIEVNISCGSTGRSGPAGGLLFALDSPVAHGGRGLVRGEVFDTEGELVVSVVQEGLIRTSPRDQ
jgi:Thioesterase-like superfamily